MLACRRSPGRSTAPATGARWRRRPRRGPPDRPSILLGNLEAKVHAGRVLLGARCGRHGTGPRCAAARPRPERSVKPQPGNYVEGTPMIRGNTCPLPPARPCRSPSAPPRSVVDSLARRADADPFLDDLDPQARAAWCTSSGSPPGRPLRQPAAAAAGARGRTPGGRRAVGPPGRGARPRPVRASPWPWPPAPRRASRSATRLPSPKRRSTRCGPAPRLLLFPTKALAQDQLRSLGAFGLPRRRRRHLRRRQPPRAAHLGPPPRQRRAHQPRDAPRGILPHHARWATFLMRPALRRGRRAAHPAGHLRQPRGPPAAAAAAPLRALRLGPASCSPRPPSGSPAALASALCGLPVAEVTDDGSPPRRAAFALWNPPLLDAATGGRALGQQRRRPRSWPSWCGTATAPSPSPAAARAPSWWRPRRGAALPDRPGAARPARTAAATCQRAARDRARAVRRASCAGWWPPTPWSSASTSAGSTPASSTASPAPSRRCGSRPGRAGRAQQESLAVLVAGDDQLDQ